MAVLRGTRVRGHLVLPGRFCLVLGSVFSSLTVKGRPPPLLPRTRILLPSSFYPLATHRSYRGSFSCRVGLFWSFHSRRFRGVPPSRPRLFPWGYRLSFCLLPDPSLFVVPMVYRARRVYAPCRVPRRHRGGIPYPGYAAVFLATKTLSLSAPLSEACVPMTDMVVGLQATPGPGESKALQAFLARSNTEGIPACYDPLTAPSCYWLTVFVDASNSSRLVGKIPLWELARLPPVPGMLRAWRVGRPQEIRTCGLLKD